jgi:hypothetical protein
MLHVLILGGYGNFGGILSRSLAVVPNIRLTLAGRSLEKAQHFIETHLQQAASPVQAAVLDAHDTNLQVRLTNLAPDLVIHTSGPFQGQDYHVAESCIRAGIHYIDLADGRRFVSDFAQLDALAKAHDVLAVSGASTLPALSTAVIEHFKDQFLHLTQLEYAISLGNQSERGLATVEAILSYTGKAFTTRIQGKMQSVTGWQRLHRMVFAVPLGRRWLANCDIPDLSLFQNAYPTITTQRFYAGLELGIMHVGLWGLSWLVRIGLIANLARYSKPIIWLSNRLIKLGSPNGGMVMMLSGMGLNGRPLTIRWDLVALDNDGPRIPTIPALILARKMADGRRTQRGATACINLISLDEFSQAVAGYNLQQHVQHNYKTTS